MIDVQTEIASILELLRTVKPADAEQRTRALLDSLSADEIAIHEDAITSVVDRFLPKRRSALVRYVEDRKTMASQKPSIVEPAERHLGDGLRRWVPNPSRFDDELGQLLTGLSNYHIFQWSTTYREQLTPIYAAAVQIVGRADLREEAIRSLRQRFAEHAFDIFQKGYEYTKYKPGSHGLAVTKSTGGLQRFLELPIEFYSAGTNVSSAIREGPGNRDVCSAIISGILEGYGSVTFGNDRGWSLLPRFTKAWAHYIGFMTSTDLALIADELEPGPFQEGLRSSVIPLLSAIDSLAANGDGDFAGLPRLGQYVFDMRRLDMSLHPSSKGLSAKFIDVQCYLDQSTASTRALDEAANRGVALVVAPLRADVRDWAESHDVLRSLTVNVLGDSQSPALRAREILQYAILREVGSFSPDAPLTYNFAKDFPLHNPFLTQYFHVYRRSVRNLLRSFEGRNGVRLWCSVRRSGKTTACFDLSASTGSSIVISQTCDSTDERIESTILYDAISEALFDGTPIERNFFRTLIDRCSARDTQTDPRFVLVLDEYETLFERLRLAAARDRELRYTVVQPLLNQMVAFSGSHLIVFIGQRPDAHFILMDQNQLSAYVQQDSFPLFANDRLGSAQSEFHELLKKILTARISFDNTFVDAVFAETGGHPFLTVKVLIALSDWLIEQRRALYKLELTAEDFAKFARQKLTPSTIGTSQDYVFFREAISEALSQNGLRETPWLHAVYQVLRALARQHPTDLRCTRREFVDMVDGLAITSDLGLTAEHLLSSAGQANFLMFDERLVWARIPILARISGCTTAKVIW